MTLEEIMRYIESEFSIINGTPCEFCGSDFVTEEIAIEISNDMPFDICECTCPECGNNKTFKFHAPFVDKKTLLSIKRKMH